MLHIVGLGPSNLKDISLESMKILQQADKVIMRTGRHPGAQELAESGIDFVTCDDFYEQNDNFEQVYQKIVDYCMEESEKYKNIAYVVPGSPLVAEKTVQLLLQKGKKFGNIGIKVLPALSFLDLVYNRLYIDPCDGLRVIDALGIEQLNEVSPVHTVITQVYSQRIASEVKLQLMDLYADETPIIFMRNLGLSDEVIREIPLYELDRQKDINHLTTIYIPPAAERTKADFSQLAATMQTLRSPQGCLWDQEQTHASIRHNLLEEAYEVIEAIDLQDSELLCEELGDVLLQVVFHAQMAHESGCFDLQDVIDGINKKLIRRHPHVFGEITVANSAEIVYNWEQIKLQEKQTRSRVLDGVTKGMSSLMTAYKMQHKAAKVGFDWDDTAPVYEKIQEELTEVQTARTAKELEKEVGDLLFAVVNLARHLKIIPEMALNTSNRSFKTRFEYVEEQVLASGKQWSDFTLEDLDEFWAQSKLREKVFEA